MIKIIRKLQNRQPSQFEVRLSIWYGKRKKAIKYWLIRKTIARKYITISWPGIGYVPELGDIYVKKGVSMEHIGLGRWVAIPEDDRIHMKLGVRIKAHYYGKKKNNFIVRDGEIILWA